MPSTSRSFVELVGSLGDTGLHGEHALHSLLGGGFILAGHDKKFLHVLAVSVAHLAGGLVVAQVIVALAHGDAALVHLHQVDARILEIGVATYGEEAAYTFGREASHHILQLTARGDGLHLGQVSLDRREAFGIAAHTAHSQAVEAAYFLLERPGLGLLGGHLLNEFAQLLAVVLLQGVELVSSAHIPP